MMSNILEVQNYTVMAQFYLFFFNFIYVFTHFYLNVFPVVDMQLFYVLFDLTCGKPFILLLLRLFR